MNGFLHVGLTVLEKIFYHRSLLIFYAAMDKDTLKFENALLMKSGLRALFCAAAPFGEVHPGKADCASNINAIRSQNLTGDSQNLAGIKKDARAVILFKVVS
jgi:hypothetical protein